MKYLVSAAEMRLYDNNTIEKIGIPAMVLMERAALAAVECIKAKCMEISEEKHVLILAGIGNNGGDGLAVARLLAEEDYQVEVWSIGNAEKASEQWKRQREILNFYPVNFVDVPTLSRYDVLVDALFGVGISREVEGDYRDAIQLFNQLKGYKLSLDMPSGIDADTGKVCGVAVKADETVTFGFAKRGLFFYPGCEYAGIVKDAEIGISSVSFLGAKPEMFAYDEPVDRLLPARNPVGNKSTFGKVLLVAGSDGMAGAAILAAKGAYRMGAGMVKVLTVPGNRSILQQAIPEALFGTYESLKESEDWADVLVIGPGLGRSAEAEAVLAYLLKESTKPLVVDADGLNLIAGSEEIKALVKKAKENARQMIFTPHVGELRRIGQGIREEYKLHLWEFAKAVSAGFGVVVVAKDARSFICNPKGEICVNLSGNSGMATAGSGDVLAGVIGALLAQGMPAYKAACVGAYIHGKAGEAAALKVGEYGCMAGDIANFLVTK